MIASDDYVIASPDLLLRSEDEFYQLITQNTRRPVKLIVFNARNEDLREIEIVPNFEWGGEGCMGCDVGSGMVHWIPKKFNDKPVIGTIQTSAPPMTSSSPVPPQPQPQSSAPSLQDSPSKAPPVVNVNIPASRPVVDFLVPAPDTTSAPVMTTAMPPPMTQFYHQPHSSQVNQQQQQQKQTSHPQFLNAIDDEDIPLPNFTVPSDIVHQK